MICIQVFLAIQVSLGEINKLITFMSTKFRHGVKVGLGPRDPGPPSKFKSGTQDPPKV